MISEIIIGHSVIHCKSKGSKIQPLGVVHILNPGDESFFPWLEVDNFDPTISTLEAEKSTPQELFNPLVLLLR